jgi:hypothetical protein
MRGGKIIVVDGNGGRLSGKRQVRGDRVDTGKSGEAVLIDSSPEGRVMADQGGMSDRQLRKSA